MSVTVTMTVSVSLPVYGKVTYIRMHLVHMQCTYVCMLCMFVFRWVKRRCLVPSGVFMIYGIEILVFAYFAQIRLSSDVARRQIKWRLGEMKMVFPPVVYIRMSDYLLDQVFLSQIFMKIYELNIIYWPNNNSNCISHCNNNNDIFYL